MFLDLCFFYSSTIFVFSSFFNQTSIVNFFLLDWDVSSSCFVFLRFTISTHHSHQTTIIIIIIIINLKIIVIIINKFWPKK
jgi:hypothetical protein